MDEILRGLPPGARVLDLGCRDGSFRAEAYPELKSSYPAELRAQIERG